MDTGSGKEGSNKGDNVAGFGGVTLPLIPEHERSSLPLEGFGVLTHPDVEAALERILQQYRPPPRKYAVFLPCSVHKPYHESPSHRLFDSIIFSHLPKEDTYVVVFGTCGVVPREFDCEYPFSNYRFMLGRCTLKSVHEMFLELETERLSRFLKATENCYDIRLAYCLGEFREAMRRASEESGIDVHILPQSIRYQQHLVGTGKPLFGSLSEPFYLRQLSQYLAELTHTPPLDIKENYQEALVRNTTEELDEANES
ncbi:MAG: DUF5591 domain-containing protein [Methermicoccaceae archaeon]